MPRHQARFAFRLLLLLSLSALGQTSRPVAPLPNDPLELATGPALQVDTAERRAVLLGLLERARQNASELYATGAPPFALKVSFTSTGDSRTTGAGEMEETRLSRAVWRWSARLGDYSQLRIFQHGIAYDDKTPGPIPLRVQMVRGTVLWSMFQVRPGAKMRMATAKWKGEDLMCALLSGDEEVTTAAQGRRWEEKEYCVDPKSGLVRIYSEAPGIYVIYDYNDALQFHGRTVARSISVVEEGNAVLQIDIDSLTDPGTPDRAEFTPTRQMLTQGPGIILRPPVRFTELAPSPAGYKGIVQPVIIHAAIDQDGKVVEAESLQNSDPTLSNLALAAVKRSAYPSADPRGIPVQTEAFIQVTFGGAR